MSLEATLDQDLKAALLNHDERTVSTLRMLKSALLYAKVAAGSKDSALEDDAVIAILGKEAKKRQESADLFTQGGNQAKAEAELAEKAIIEKYLPAQLSEAEIVKLVDEAIAASPGADMAKMGQIIGQVRAKAGATADGGTIARLVKERLGQ
jgi:uncharacterized protein YqeY